MLKSVFVLVLVCLIPVMVQAGSGAGAINMQFNTSARAAGMGDAGVAVTWDMDTNHWANPALLAFRPGIHYRSFESYLIPSLDADISLTNEEITFGAYGVTFLLAKGPVKGNYLDMGTQNATDENGESLGTFNSYLKSESWGLGVNGVEVLEHLLGKRSGSWGRYVALAGGVTWYDYEDLFAPAYLESSISGTAEGSAMNLGYVLRVTPVSMSRGRGVLNNGVLGLELSGSFGQSILNKTDDEIRHVDADQSDPFPRLYVAGWAANAQITLADDLREKLNEMGFGFLGDMINPLVGFTKNEQLIEPGYVWNYDDNDYIYEHDTSGDYEEKGRGWELGLMNIFFIREGHLLAEYGDIDGATKGGGWKIQAGRFGGFRKDWADVPLATGLGDSRRETWSVWVDPLAIYDGFIKK